jgi:uncharacterized protein
MRKGPSYVSRAVDRGRSAFRGQRVGAEPPRLKDCPLACHGRAKELCVKPDWEQAVRRGDLQCLGRLLAAGVDINARDRYGQTALMIAAHKGKSGVVRFLLKYGAGLDYTAKYGLSALMLAVIGGHADIVRALVEAGADLTIRGTGAPGFAGKTALELATAQGHFDMAALLRGSSPLPSSSAGEAEVPAQGDAPCCNGSGGS